MDTSITISIFWQVGLACWAFAGLSLLSYHVIAATRSGSTGKYAFVAAREPGLYRFISILFSTGAGLLLMQWLWRQVASSGTFMAFFVVLVSLGIAFAIGYAFSQYFTVYYPFVLERKLNRIRFHDRKSPAGNPLRLLREHEEDAHMTAEMIAQEAAFTYDYDVWLDETTGYKQIERYDGHLHALVCPRCEFRTMKDFQEEVLKKPTASERGLIKKHYHCGYCHHEETRDVSVASLLEDQEMVHGAVVV
jgi:hypothetical protein